MLRKGFLRFHRAAETAGYPSLFVVTLMALAIIVSAIGLLAIIRSVWALGLTLLALIASIALVAGGIDAMFSDDEEPAAGPPHEGSASAGSETRASLPPPGLGDPGPSPERRAA